MNPLPFIEAMWKPILVVLCALLVWVFVRIEDAHIHRLEGQNATLTANLGAAQGQILQQNLAISDLQAAGKKQQARINELALAGAAQAEKVVTQWKTKYLPQVVPVDCFAAVAAGAANAASVARLYSSSTP